MDLPYESSLPSDLSSIRHFRCVTYSEVLNRDLYVFRSCGGGSCIVNTCGDFLDRPRGRLAPENHFLVFS